VPTDLIILHATSSLSQVSIYQFLFGFVLMPLQLLPHVGSDSGMSLVEIGESFNQG
jgi:hypothetical protein